MATTGEVNPAGSAPVWGLPRPLPAPTRLPRRAEIVIVGAGITGVAMLRWLVGRGVDAILLERDHVGSGATGRNAGFLLAGVADNYASAVVRYGRTVAADVWAFTRENHAIIAATAESARAEYRRGGSWTLALDRDEAVALEESADLLAEDGFQSRWLAAPPLGALRGLVNPGDGEVNPLLLLQALAEPNAGRIHERTEVVAVEDGASSASLLLRDGSAIEAATVVLATNAWTSRLVSAVRIRPVRAQMLAASGADATIPCPAYAERGHRYWRRRADGSVLVGGFRHRAAADEVGFDLSPTAAVQRHLDTQLGHLCTRGRVTHRWSGTMGFSDDGLPLAGHPPSLRRVVICAGYTGHGMGFAMHATRCLADHLLAAQPLPAWLDAARSPGSP